LRIRFAQEKQTKMTANSNRFMNKWTSMLFVTRMEAIIIMYKSAGEFV